MHELSLLEDVLSIIEDNADTQGYTSVKKVSLEIGALSCVEPEALRFGFDIVMKNSLADGATLDIVTMPGQAICQQCGCETEVFELHTPCPDCQSFSLDIQSGLEMRVRDLIVN
jgi:hydrogenase nickel incorporation protein HypA/HybF